MGKFSFFLHKLIRNTPVSEIFDSHPFVELKMNKFNKTIERRGYCTSSWNTIRYVCNRTTLSTIFLMVFGMCTNVAVNNNNRNELKMNKLCALCCKNRIYDEISVIFRGALVHCHSKMSFAFTFYNMQNGIVLSHDATRIHTEGKFKPGSGM